MKAAPDAELDTLREQLIAWARRTTRPRWIWLAKPPCVSLNTPCCCNIWISTGANTWPRWTTCARAFTCAATRKRTKQEYKRRAFRAVLAHAGFDQGDVAQLLFTVRIQSAPKKWPPWKPKRASGRCSSSMLILTQRWRPDVEALASSLPW